MAKISPTRWWAELGLDARDAIQQGSYHSAYSLVADAGLPRDATGLDANLEAKCSEFSRRTRASASDQNARNLASGALAGIAVWRGTLCADAR